MGDLIHLRGWEDSLHDWVGHGQDRVQSKCRDRKGTEPLRGSWGRRGVPTLRGAHSQRGNQQGWGEIFGGLEGNAASTFTACSGPSETPWVQGMKLHPLGPPTAVWALRMWEGREGEEK